MKSESKILVSPYLPKFPLLARRTKELDLILLFTSEKSATVVSIPKNYDNYDLGYHSNIWDSVFSDNWQILPNGSSVTLTQ